MCQASRLSLGTCNVEPRFQNGKTVSSLEHHDKITQQTYRISHRRRTSSIYTPQIDYSRFASPTLTYILAEEQASSRLLHLCQQRPPQAPMHLPTAVQRAEIIIKGTKTGNIQSSRRQP